MRKQPKTEYPLNNLPDRGDLEGQMDGKKLGVLS